MKLADRLQTVEEYYFSRKLREVRALIADGKPVINMGIGSPDLPPPAVAVQALTDALANPVAHQYQNYQGLPELRKAIAGFYERHFSVSADAESEILPLMGSKEGILHISMAFLNKGDKVLIPNPGYPTYESVARLVEAEPVFFDLKEENHWQPDLDALEKRDLSGVKLMWVNYPNMPTGARATSELFQKLIDFGKKHQILIVNDNPYSAILNPQPLSILSAEGASEVAIELNSLSKTFNLSGWRVGYAIGKKDYIDAILKVKSNMDSGMFYPVQKGAVAALHSDRLWFDDLNEIYRSRRDLIFVLADKLGCSYDKDAAGMFVWAKLPDAVFDAAQFVDELLYDKHLFVTPGKIFGSNGNGYVRFSLCVPEDKIREAIKRVD